jgi:uncharacterized protein YndB with AHSA1/START domain
MARKNETKAAPLVVARVFQAPPAQVFAVWSSADHMKRWFSPAGFTVPEATIDFRPGGLCEICMRSPEGQNFWSRGKYLEVSPPDRLVFELVVGEPPGFTAHTTVTFVAEEAGNRMTVHQDYEIHDTGFNSAIAGAPEGWRTTLDKLAEEVARMARSVVHGMFRIERVFDVRPGVVFRALSDRDAKARWFAGGEGYVLLEREMDVRPGGRERVSGRWANGTVSTFDAIYLDVVTDRRLVYAYEMTLDGRKISVSLATLELEAAGAGTRLLVTEQGAFLDGYEDAGSREHGTGFLLDRLGASLRNQ